MWCKISKQPLFTVISICRLEHKDLISGGDFLNLQLRELIFFLNETTSLHRSFKVEPPDPKTKGDFEIVAAETF